MENHVRLDLHVPVGPAPGSIQTLWVGAGDVTPSPRIPRPRIPGPVIEGIESQTTIVLL